MNIIIVGAGKVGTELAKRFAHANHNVIVLEKEMRKVVNLRNTLDVMVIEESGKRIDTLEQAGVRNADVLIAVTDSDEINIMVCMIAKKVSNIKTVARIRNPEYCTEGTLFSNEQLGIDYIIDPERLTAIEIAKLIKTPVNRENEYFADGKLELSTFKVEKDSEIAGRKISSLPQSQASLIVAISRNNGESIVPGGEDRILPLDTIYVFGKTGFLSEIGSMVRDKVKSVRNIMILGGGKIGLKLAQILESDKKNGLSIKLVEKCDERCMEISKTLSRTLILNADCTDISFLREEDLSNMDILVSATNIDEINILSAILAKKLGVKKTIVEINKPDYEFLIPTLDIDIFVSPRLLVANKLVKLFRKSESLIETVLMNGKAELLEITVPVSAPIVNIPLADLKLSKGILIGGIVRENIAIIPKGKDFLLPNDQVVVFALTKLVAEVEKLFSVKSINH
jgi:trk system potassium uptake protein TrkA